MNYRNLKQLRILFVLGGLLLFAGCSHVVSAAPTDDSLGGDAWYVNNVGFGGLIFKTQVFYCKEPATRGPAQCFEAKMHEIVAPAGAYGGQPAYQQPPAAAPVQPAAQPAAAPSQPAAPGQPKAPPAQ